MKNKANVDKYFQNNKFMAVTDITSPSQTKKLVEKYVYIMSLVSWRSRGCGKSYTFLSLAPRSTYILFIWAILTTGLFFIANYDVTLYS